jgi:hypothetical protein
VTSLGEAIGGISSVVIIALGLIVLLLAILVIGMIIRGIGRICRKRRVG